MNSLTDQSGSSHGDSTPRSPFSPSTSYERQKGLADSKFQRPMANSSALGTCSFLSMHLCVCLFVCIMLLENASLHSHSIRSTTDPSSPGSMLHGGNKFHEAFQMKQGRFDLQAAKISEMMKSNNLDVLLP